jgi:hypothetical protein
MTTDRPVKALLIVVLASLAVAQTPDAFTGTWKLNAAKSRFTDPREVYSAGVRAYSPAPDGTHVIWTMTDAAGNTIRGEYIARCVKNICTSDAARWKIKDPRTVIGDLLEAGAVVQNFTRHASPDGKLLTITFFKPGQKKPSSIQVWDKQ